MKVKTIFRNTCLGLFALGMFSSRGDMLDTNPTQSMSGSGLLANGNAAQVPLNGIYRSMYTSGWTTTANTHQCFGIPAYTIMADVMGEDMIMQAMGSGWFWFDALYNVKSRYASRAWRSYELWKAYYTWISNANYIIFRDIDLGSENWTPLTFQGTMIGAKIGANAAADARIWNDNEIIATEKPVISNVTATQSSKLNVGEQMGVGFFSTISSEVNENDIGLSKGLVKVSNLRFEDISVDNQSTTTKYDQTLVNGLVTGLSKVLGGLVDTLLWILSFGNLEAGLRDTLTKVLDARKKDPTALATGAIAGRVESQVELSDIEVVNVNVKNVNHNTGGFVGYVVGTTQYDGLSNALGGTAKILSKILNVIPGLGLGDLITILLGKVIELDHLIPIAYINPTIDNCNILL